MDDEKQKVKDLLLGKRIITLSRIGASTNIKLFMKACKSKRKDKIFLLKLADYLISSFRGDGVKKTIYSRLDSPHSEYNIIQIVCNDSSDADSIVERFNEYEEICLK